MVRTNPLVTAVCIGALLATPALAQRGPERWPAPAPLAGAHGAPGEAVRAWMSERLQAFGLADSVDGLRLEREEPLPGGGTRVLIRQLWRGIPVAGADARAIVDADGRLVSLVDGFAPDLRAPLEPRIARGLAGALAAAAAPAGRADQDGTITLAVARLASGDHLVWQVERRSADGEPLRTIVDAVTGEVLEADAGIAHAVGRVYPTDPRQPLEERELPHLFPGPPLRAPDFGIDDALYPAALPVAPGDFRFAPDDSSFDQVNLYWHVAHDLDDFFGSLGYAGPPDSLVVRVHFALDPEVARTSGRFVTFGRAIPGFCQEPSRSQDIVYHELAHAVLYGFGIQPGGVRREANALHEGLADYFAAAFTGDPAIGEWAYLVFPAGATRVDQPAPPWDMAHYDLVAYGGGGLTTAWANGMILSSTLWDLRRRIGSASDSLVLEALAYLPTVPTWAQFVNALLVADLDHHDGRNWGPAGDVFRQRGIRGAVAARINGPATLAPAQPGTFDALPCCGGAPGRYHWRARPWCRLGPCGPWQDLADGTTLRTSFLGDTQLELSTLSPFGDADTVRQLVLVEAPRMTLQGPLRALRNSTGTWTARIVAAAPIRLTWYRQWLRPGAVEEMLGRGPSVSFAVETSFSLRATLEDGMGRAVVQQITVEAFVDKPPPGSTAWVRLSQTMDAALRAETHIELQQATALRLSVYDVRGRERLRLADGPAPRGERVIHWSAGPLEPGIYFLRARTAEDHADVLRFIVIH